MTDFQELAKEAIGRALSDGTWKDLPWLADAVKEHGLPALLQNCTGDAKSATLSSGTEANVAAEEEGPGWPEWANWRLQLPGSIPSVVYFHRRPQYAELKAFAGVAGIAPNDCTVEERI